ncbi:MAG: hypothetical protein ABI678_26820 [Kofleriaceae bacterium]
MVLTRALAIVALGAATAAADPSSDLRDANAAASAGDWAKVQVLVAPLLEPSLAPADRAEAYRLAGLAAFFMRAPDRAEQDFVAYLKLDLGGHLDPALYPPEVVNFFNDVRARHAAELRAARPRPNRYRILTVFPPIAQLQNGDTTKAIVIGGLLGITLGTNVVTYLYLRSWCHNAGNTCDDSGKNHFRGAQTLSTLNVLGGVGFILTYGYGVWDGVRGYRHRSFELAPYVSATGEATTLGIGGSF